MIGKIEIKIWDKCLEKYEDSDYLFINDYLSVYREVLGYQPYLKQEFDLEPHFYKDGERIA